MNLALALGVFVKEKAIIHSGPLHSIYQTSTYVFDSAQQAAAVFSGSPGYRYIRSVPNTPTHAAFVKKICSLEGGEDGIAFSSGMAAETVVFLSLLSSKDHLLAGDIIYGGTYGLIDSLLPKFGIQISFVDTTDIDLVKSAIKENTRMLFWRLPPIPLCP